MAAEQRASKALAAAHGELVRARRELARATKPAAHGAVYAAAWRAPCDALDAAMARLSEPSVVGWSLRAAYAHAEPTAKRGATPRRHEAATRTRAARVAGGPLLAVIYVRDAGATLPARLKLDGAWVPTHCEVVGALVRHAVGGISIGPSADRRKGTLGCYARADGRTIALTAMHVTALEAGPAHEMSTPSRFDDANGKRIGMATRGSRQGVDIARVELDQPHQAINALPRIGPIRGWRRVMAPYDNDTVVQMYGATTGYQTGHIVDACAQFPSEQLADAIVASIYTEEGDSGAALVDGQGFVLGFLVGQYQNSNLRVFSAAGPALHAVDADIP